MGITELYRAIAPLAPPEAGKAQPGAGPGARSGPDSEFSRLLAEQLKFSKHAETRIRSREIPWNDALEKRVLQGIEAARAKGSRETLILADGVAVIANVKSRTVITAMDRSQMKERVFTNIDSAVLV